YLPKMYEEEVYIFYGQFQDHPRYGRQFQATHYRKKMPETREGVIQYLSSDLFKGIGKKTAEAIVDTLGENAISRILANPEVLEQVPKLSKEKAENLYETLQEHQGLEKVIIVLNKYGFGP
ncbi:ATP-dependent RecD-like DNA helicase, partial [Pseudomonas aeruginosa]